MSSHCRSSPPGWQGRRPKACPEHGSSAGTQPAGMRGLAIRIGVSGQALRLSRAGYRWPMQRPRTCPSLRAGPLRLRRRATRRKRRGGRRPKAPLPLRLSVSRWAYGPRPARQIGQSRSEAAEIRHDHTCVTPRIVLVNPSDPKLHRSLPAGTAAAGVLAADLPGSADEPVPGDGAAPLAAMAAHPYAMIEDPDSLARPARSHMCARISPR